MKMLNLCIMVTMVLYNAAGFANGARYNDVVGVRSDNTEPRLDEASYKRLIKQHELQMAESTCSDSQKAELKMARKAFRTEMDLNLTYRRQAADLAQQRNRNKFERYSYHSIVSDTIEYASRESLIDNDRFDMDGVIPTGKLYETILSPVVVILAYAMSNTLIEINKGKENIDPYLLTFDLTSNESISSNVLLDALTKNEDVKDLFFQLRRPGQGEDEQKQAVDKAFALLDEQPDPALAENIHMSKVNSLRTDIAKIDLLESFLLKWEETYYSRRKPTLTDTLDQEASQEIFATLAVHTTQERAKMARVRAELYKKIEHVLTRDVHCGL